MRPEVIDWHRIPVRGGQIRIAFMKTWSDTWREVGDRTVPALMVLELREPDAPAIDLTIEVIDHVPRATDLHFLRLTDGREIRRKDLNLNLDDLVEQTVAIASARAGDDGVSRFPGALPPESRLAEIRRGMATVQHARGRSQRVMTTDRLRKVSAIYSAQEAGGIEAVAEVYNVHRATAARWVAKARESGLLPPREDA